MADFVTQQIDPITGQISFQQTDTLSIPSPVNTNPATATVQAVGVIQGFNLGDGVGIYTTVSANGRQLSGFRSLVAGSGVTLTPNDTTITIDSNSTDVLGQLSFESLGGGPSVFLQKIAGDVQLRSFAASGIVSVQEAPDTIVISASAVTSVGLNGSSNIAVTGSTITTTGSFAIDLTATGVSEGNYSNPVLTVDSFGRITAITNGTIDTVTVQAGSGITVSPGPNYTVGLANSGVVAGPYTAASIIVDANGRVTAATNNTIPPAVTASNLGTGAQVFATVSNQAMAFRSILGAGAITVTQDANDITIGTTATGTVTSVNATGSNGVAVTGGPISTSGTFSVALSNTTVQAGNYVAPNLTIDSTGRITSASSNPLGEANTASNVGGGFGLFAMKSGVDLQFRTLVSGDGIALSSTGTTVTIAQQKSCGAALIATGTTQANGTALTNDWNEVLTAAAGSGVVLAGNAGNDMFIANYSGNAINVYPPVGSKINALSANAPFVQATGTSVTYRALTATQWYC